MDENALTLDVTILGRAYRVFFHQTPLMIITEYLPASLAD